MSEHSNSDCKSSTNNEKLFILNYSKNDGDDVINNISNNEKKSAINNVINLKKLNNNNNNDVIVTNHHNNNCNNIKDFDVVRNKFQNLGLMKIKNCNHIHNNNNRKDMMKMFSSDNGMNNNVESTQQPVNNESIDKDSDSNHLNTNGDDHHFNIDEFLINHHHHQQQENGNNNHIHQTIDQQQQQQSNDMDIDTIDAAIDDDQNLFCPVSLLEQSETIISSQKSLTKESLIILNRDIDHHEDNNNDNQEQNNKKLKIIETENITSTSSSSSSTSSTSSLSSPSLSSASNKNLNNNNNKDFDNNNLYFNINHSNQTNFINNNNNNNSSNTMNDDDEIFNDSNVLWKTSDKFDTIISDNDQSSPPPPLLLNDINANIDVETNANYNNNNNNDDNDNNIDDNNNIIEIQLTDLKSNYSEFQDFVLLFLYVMNVQHCEFEFYRNGMKLKFETDYCLLPNVNINNNNNEIPILNPIQLKRNYIYLLNLTFKNEIVPEKCSVKISKKTVEIRLQKLILITWGTIKELCITPNLLSSTDTVVNKTPMILDSNSSLPPPPSSSSSSISPLSTYSLNKWTPCRLSSSSNDSNCRFSQDNMMLTVSKSSDNNNDINDNGEIESAVNTNRYGRFRGYTGLDNLGNTCFMNAVLQCLANTDPLKDYFLSNKYLNDINTTNPLGMKGMMARAFAQFLLQLWMGKQSSISPTRLKSLIGEKVITFVGFSQHDAQELMSFLLDAIHEDLNRNETKTDNHKNNNDDDDDSLLDYDINDCPSNEIREKIFTRIKEIADRAWKQYRLRNSSIIIDLFCGQFKSILTCPDCMKKSIIFDPFLFVPLPIPPPKLIYNVIYFDRDNQTDMCKSISKFSIRVAQNSTVNDLLEKLYREKQIIPTKNVRIMQPQLRSQQTHNHHIRDIMPVKFFNSNWLLTDCQQPQQSSFMNNNHSSLNISNQQPLLLFEVPPSLLSDSENVDNNEHVEFCIVQRELRENSDFRSHQIGLPFVCSIKKSRFSYSHLCEVLCSYARFSVIAYRQAMALNNESDLDPNQFGNLNRFNVHSFTPKNVAKSSNNNNNMETNDPLPHLIYHKCKIPQPNDTIAPFLLMTLSFDMNAEETEITPPASVSYKNVDMEQDDDEYGDVNSSTSTNGDDSPMHEPSSSLQEEGEEEFLIENDEQEQQCQQSTDEYEEDEIISADNDQLLDINNLYFIGMDWITVKNFPSYPFAVKLNSLEKNIEYENIGNDEDDVTLDDCLQAFIEPEILGPQNCWRCPNCKVPREASKQLSFWSLPSILVIQLKRLKTHSSSYFHEKINYMIKYPFELNLEKYTANHHNNNDNDNNKQQPSPIYELYAVVNHQGRPAWGHYTAFARSSHSNEFGWRLFDDSCVDKVMDDREVITSKAYLLFYRRREIVD